jgi:small subunit ribosomal protein S6
MFVFDANLAGKDWPGLEQHVQDLVQRHAGKLVHAERWPDRKLAYEIKGCKKGTYYLTYFNAPTTAIQGLQRDCELSDRVLRVMFLYDDGLAEECEKLKARDAAKAADARARAEAEEEAPDRDDDNESTDDDSPIDADRDSESDD